MISFVFFHPIIIYSYKKDNFDDKEIDWHDVKGLDLSVYLIHIGIYYLLCANRIEHSRLP